MKDVCTGRQSVVPLYTEHRIGTKALVSSVSLTSDSWRCPRRSLDQMNGRSRKFCRKPKQAKQPRSLPV
jgi:hypothetical protein